MIDTEMSMHWRYFVAACVGLVMCPAAQVLATDSGGREASLRPPRVSAGSTMSDLGGPFGGWGLWAPGSRARVEPRVALRDVQPDTLPLGGDLLRAGRFLLRVAPVNDAPFETNRRDRFGLPDGKAETPPVYGSYLLNDSISLDVSAGKVSSFTLNAAHPIGTFGIGGRIGYFDMRVPQDWYLEPGFPRSRQSNDRTVALRQAFVGVDAIYGFGRNWQLRGAAVYRRDVARDYAWSGLPNGVGVPQLADRDEREWAVGVRYYGWHNFALNLEFLKTSGGYQFGNESLTLTGRIGF
jgi:hypothetical protein